MLRLLVLLLSLIVASHSETAGAAEQPYTIVCEGAWNATYTIDPANRRFALIGDEHQLFEMKRTDSISVDYSSKYFSASYDTVTSGKYIDLATLDIHSWTKSKYGTLNSKIGQCTRADYIAIQE